MLVTFVFFFILLVLFVLVASKTNCNKNLGAAMPGLVIFSGVIVCINLIIGLIAYADSGSFLVSGKAHSETICSEIPRIKDALYPLDRTGQLVVIPLENKDQSTNLTNAIVKCRDAKARYNDNLAYWKFTREQSIWFSRSMFVCDAVRNMEPLE